MKSIDEAAVDYAATGEVLPNGKVMVNFQVEMAFEAGANYVLEQIEGHINRLEYGLNANCMVTAKNACECLRSIMEQLKK